MGETNCAKIDNDVCSMVQMTEDQKYPRATCSLCVPWVLAFAVGDHFLEVCEAFGGSWNLKLGLRPARKLPSLHLSQQEQQILFYFLKFA